jgi:hypothetical protein
MQGVFLLAASLQTCIPAPMARALQYLIPFIVLWQTPVSPSLKCHRKDGSTMACKTNAVHHTY